MLVRLPREGLKPRPGGDFRGVLFLFRESWMAECRYVVVLPLNEEMRTAFLRDAVSSQFGVFAHKSCYPLEKYDHRSSAFLVRLWESCYWSPSISHIRKGSHSRSNILHKNNA